MLTGAYEDAIKAFSNANECKRTKNATYQRAKCHVLIGSIESACEDLNKLVTMEPEEQAIQYDRDTLQVH